MELFNKFEEAMSNEKFNVWAEWKIQLLGNSGEYKYQIILKSPWKF